MDATGDFVIAWNQLPPASLWRCWFDLCQSLHVNRGRVRKCIPGQHSDDGGILCLVSLWIRAGELRCFLVRGRSVYGRNARGISRVVTIHRQSPKAVSLRPTTSTWVFLSTTSFRPSRWMVQEISSSPGKMVECLWAFPPTATTLPECLRGSEFNVFTSAFDLAEDFNPSVAMDRTGDFVVRLAPLQFRYSQSKRLQVIVAQRVSALRCKSGKPNPRQHGAGRIAPCRNGCDPETS